MQTKVYMDASNLSELAIGLDLHGSALVEPSVALWDGQSFASWNADVPYYPACMIKVPLCLAAYILADDGTIPLEQIEIKPEQVVESVFQSKLTAGLVVTLEHLIHDALYYSDNTAANVLIDLVGRERGTNIIHSLGLSNTAIRRWLVGAVMKPDPQSTGRNAHTAHDAALLLSLIAKNEVPHSSEILAHLKHSSMPELGFFGLREGDCLHYKDGYTSSVLNIGIVVTRPKAQAFVLVIYTNLPFSPDNYAKVMGFVRRVRAAID